MDTLITLGTFAAYLWSVWALVFGSAGRIGIRHEVMLFGPVHDATSVVYFEVAAAVTVFLLLGRVIEQRSTRRAGAALRALLDLGVREAFGAPGIQERKPLRPVAASRFLDGGIAHPGRSGAGGSDRRLAAWAGPPSRLGRGWTRSHGSD